MGAGRGFDGIQLRLLLALDSFRVPGEEGLKPPEDNTAQLNGLPPSRCWGAPPGESGVPPARP
jgi:hypothetical protein